MLFWHCNFDIADVAQEIQDVKEEPPKMKIKQELSDIHEMENDKNNINNNNSTATPQQNIVGQGDTAATDQDTER